MISIDAQQPRNGGFRGVAATTKEVAHLLFIEAVLLGEAHEGAAFDPDFGFHSLRMEGH